MEIITYKELKIEKSLFDFLKKKEVLEQFVANTKNWRHAFLTRKDFIDLPKQSKEKMNNQPITKIIESFSWKNAPEPPEFWIKLSEEFDAPSKYKLKPIDKDLSETD